MNGFKADPKKYKKYVDLKGSNEYSSVIDPVVNLLEKMGLITIGHNPTLIAITPTDIARCNDPKGRDSWNSIYYTIEDDDIAEDADIKNINHHKTITLIIKVYG
jgi:hypothetical protein